MLILLIWPGAGAFAQLRAAFTPSKSSDCESLVTRFDNQSTGNPVSWQWNFGNGSTSTDKSPSASYTSPGTYTVKLTVKDASGATSTAQETVTVWALPKPDFTASPAKGCIPFDVTFTDKSDPSNGTISTWSWDFGDGTTGTGKSPVHTYNNVLKATVTLTVTNSNHCTASKVISNIVDAGAALTANFSISNKFVCTAPGTVTIANASSGPGTLTYKWDFGDGKTATGANPGSHTYTARGIYKIKLTVSNDRGCVATHTSDEINVANFKTDFQLPASVCENASASFTAATTPQADNITWSVDKGYINSWGSSTYFSPAGTGTVKVTMTADYGTCREPITKDIVVKPAPQAAFTTDQAAICDVPATVKLTDKSTGATSWNWTFGNSQTSTQQHPTATYNSLGYYTIRLTAGNASGCTSVSDQYIQVQKPVIYAYSSIASGCEGITPNFSAYSTTGDVITKYEWDFGDGSPKSTEATPSHTYSKAGSYNVKLTYTTANGCKGTVNLYSYNSIQVYKKPKPDFTSPQAPQVCGNNWVQFNGTTDVGNHFSWNFGDYNYGTSQRTQHSYREPGTYDVTFTVSNNGCDSSVTKKAFIKAVNPFPRFSMKPVDCDNRTEISFDDNSLGAITSWKWSWGDGKENAYTTKTAVVKHKYDRTGAYLVKLTVSDGTCTSTDSATINVYAPGAITINTDKSTLCGHETLRANLLTIDQSLYYSYYGYNWSSSDGTPPYWDYYNQQYVTFTNMKPGKNAIRFFAVNHQGCIDSSNKVVVDVHGPVAKFETPPVLECRGTELMFTDQTDISKGKPVKTWSFDFGDGTGAKTFTAPPFKYTYNRAGYFIPQMTVTDEDGCRSSASGNYLQVNGPNADFTPSSTLIPPGGDVWFYNTTSETGGYATYEWDFGDGTTSTADHPSKNYPVKGTYTVKLLVRDNNGCTDSIKKQIKVSSVSADFTFTTSFVSGSGCPPVVARFTNRSLNYSSSYWDFGDGSFSTLDNPSHTYTYAGKYKVKLKVTGDAGTEDEFEQEVEVKGPYATITTSSNGGCLTKEIEFTVDAANAVNFAWDFTDGVVTETTDATIKHTFKEPGVYKPRLILSDQAGCKGTAFLKDPIVIDKLDVQLNATPEIICKEGWVAFQPAFNSYSIDELKEAATYKWTFEPGIPTQDETSAQPKFFLDQQKDYHFSLTTTTAYGCTQTVDKTVTVFPRPVADISGPLQACQFEAVAFKGSVGIVNDVTWKWEFGNGNTSTEELPGDQSFNVAGPSKAVLIVTSKDGCKDTSTHNINITAAPVVNAASASPFVCLGQNTTLSSGGGVSYQWTPVEGLSNAQSPRPQAAPTVNTEYSVTVTDANGCTNTDKVSIRVAQPFQITATPDTTLCLGHQLPLWVRGADHYKWNGEGLNDDGIPAPRANLKFTGSYTYQVTGFDADGCFTDDATVLVNVHPKPIINAGPDRIVMSGVPVLLGGPGSADIIRWTWTPNHKLDCPTCPAPRALPDLTTRYILEVENRFGCKATDDVMVHVTCDQGSVFFPNAITPNKDGVNERFYPKGRGIKEVNWMRIYDRWGGLVFENTHFPINSPVAGWDGSWKNKTSPYGTYVYAIETVCEDGTTFIFRGTVTVIR
ncbi:PKD domain-containing protein [uncultured Chitinophaga sp.]|uniref:PKD domain-containing protein n=1 Tax=uncultured Chitinophaga sp. TaxID=339340 RepID=UPI0026361872|nr:PKD domain-containing protein [uncultured Chitinophaga sp.]